MALKAWYPIVLSGKTVNDLACLSIIMYMFIISPITVVAFVITTLLSGAPSHARSEDYPSQKRSASLEQHEKVPSFYQNVLARLEEAQYIYSN